MRAKIGKKYEIETDLTSGYTLWKIGKAGKDSKNPGEETRRVIGHYSDIEQLLKAFPNRAIIASEAESLSEAIAEVRELGDDLRRAINVKRGR